MKELESRGDILLKRIRYFIRYPARKAFFDLMRNLEISQSIRRPDKYPEPTIFTHDVPEYDTTWK